MKKQTAYWLILAASVFGALLIGFFAGRNAIHSPVEISHLPQATYPSESTPTNSEPTEETKATGKVNINTATAEELEALPGIGPVYAQRIVDYRSQHGPFSNLLELTNVTGIGLERVNQIMDYATVGG